MTSQIKTEFRAGASKIDITPKVGCWLEGIPRANPSDSIHDPLYARALVVENHQTKLCLVNCDLIRVPDEMAFQLRQEIAQRIGASPDNIVLAAAHNHSGPATTEIRDGAGHLDHEYLSLLAAKLLVASQEANYRLEKALLGVGLGKETTISEYRRLVTQNGTIVMNWEKHPADDIVGPAENGDPDLGVVKITSPDGRVIAVVYNYACHVNSLPGTNYTITSDYTGYASDLIERSLGGTALFVNGAQGSVDIEGFEGRDFSGVERRGLALGRAVLDICHDMKAHPNPELKADTVSYHIPYRTIPTETLDWARKMVEQSSGESVTLRDGISDLHKANNLLRHINRKGTGINLEMVGIRMGQAVFVTFPGELFTEIGMQIKELSKTLQVHVIGLANGYHGYLPTAKAAAQGGYATDVASGAYLAENAEDTILQNARKLISRLE